MSADRYSNIYRIVNDFSRQLFLIKSPNDFYHGIEDALKKAFVDIDKYAIFRYEWDQDTFSVLSSNYLRDITDIDHKKSDLEKLLQEYTDLGKVICNNNLAEYRMGDLMPLLNPVRKGSEILIPLIPVTDPIGFLYLYTTNTGYFDKVKQEILMLMGNMIARTWNSINYQAFQIKSHKKAELEVINQRNFMNEIFDYLPINIFLKDTDGKFVYINKNAEESIGQKLNEVVGKTVHEIYEPETAKNLEEDDRKVSELKIPVLAQHEIAVAGRKRHFFTGKKLITTSDKKTLLLGFSIDITQNVNSTKIISDQKKYYQQIFNTVPNYIYVKNKKGKYLLANQAVADLFDIPQSEIISDEQIPDEKFQMETSQIREIDQKVINTGETVEYEEAIQVSNDEERWYHTTKKPLPDKDGDINVLGISVDITDRKRYSDELIKAKRAKEQFLANMSHEIRTPINGIVGMVSLLEELPASIEQKKYLNAIRTSSENLQVIINDILDLSAIETGNIKFEEIGFEIRPLLNSLISSFNYTAKKKGISISLNFDPYIDEVLIGDPVRLNQVISNLIGNSVKFTKKGIVKVYALKLGETDSVGHFQFIVDDSGIGIPSDKIEKIFDNFEQGDTSISRKYGGTGLGLAIVKQLVEAQDGKINLQSKVGKGTKFTIDLDFRIGDKEDLKKKSVKTKVSQTSDNELDLTDHKLLLVEDNDVNILYTKNILEKWNCTPDIAKNGLIALEMLKEHNYDLILMDVRMPVMDGFEASKFIRSKFTAPKNQTPIIALTANAIKGDDQKCRQAGMNDYVSKPFQPATLKEKIVSQINLKGFTKIVKPARMTRTSTDVGKITDLTYLKEMSDNDADFVADMIKSFIKQTPEDLKKIWEHFENKEHEELANVVHKIKPSITFMGIHELKDLVPSMEDNAKKGKLDALEKQIQQFEKVCRTALKELKEEALVAN